MSDTNIVGNILLAIGLASLLGNPESPLGILLVIGFLMAIYIHPKSKGNK